MHPTAQSSATIRQQLKKLHGITSRQVSVKSDVYSLGSSIRITINDPTVDIREVRNVANRHERVDRDRQTGEVMCGGNRFLFVDYGKAAAEAFATAHMMALATIMLNVDDEGDGPQLEIDGRKMHITKCGRDRFLVVRDSTRTGWLPDRAYLTPVTVAQAILATREA